ncbi:lipoate--protein ligase family protein [[Eubacterium] cellulosolvens]
MRPSPWRLIISEDDDPYRNIALDESLAQSIGSGDKPNTLRFYRNSSTVFIGRFQSIDLEVDVDICNEYNIPVIRRFTGGGAVFHDKGNLNYSLTIHKSDNRISADVALTFRRLYFGILAGLQLLGLNVDFGEGNSIFIDGKKVSGCAGSIRWGTVFQHGTLLFNSDLVMLKKVLSPSNTTPRIIRKFVKSKRSPVTNILSETRGHITMKDMLDTLIQGFSNALQVDLQKGSPDNSELRIARMLYEKKYSQPEWNLMY